jgi:O-antigen ligase
MNAITARNGAHWQTMIGDRPAEAFEPEPESAGRGSLTVTLLGLYIFLLSSRALEISRISLLHIPMILLGLLVISTLARGDLKYAFRSKTTVWFLALNAWVCVCFPFSRWRGGSLPYLVTSLESFLVYLLIVQLVRTGKDWRGVAKWYAVGVLAAGILSIFFGQSVEGRVAVMAGSLADPNEFALRLVLGLPFWWYLASQSGPVGKLVCFGLTTPIFVSFARAGSRSALLALIVLFGMMFLFVNLKQKALMCAVAVVAIVAGVALLPAYLKVRFTTLFMKHDATQLTLEERSRLGGDIGSSEAREMLLWQAIGMTRERPIVGVGPGVFGDVAWNERKESSGVGGGLLVSHNTYTQFSSETGIPGFLCFVGTLLLSIRYALSDYRRNRERNPAIARSSLYMFVCLIGLAAGIFFLSVGYGMLLAVLFGLATSLHMTAETETVKIAARTAAGEAALGTPSEPVSNGQRTPQPRVGARENLLNGRRVRFGRFMGRSTASPPSRPS